MRAVERLPEGYEEILSLDLNNDKKKKALIQGFALLIAAVLVVPMCFLVPISSMFSMDDGLGVYFLRFGVMLALMVAYVILHELVHGVAMKICGTKKVKYGFTLLYAFAGSDDYYGKREYLFIALAPVVFWGIVIAIINPFVSTAWFWVVYLIQIINLSGAAGDIYVTVKFCKLPKDVLIKDAGTSMKVFAKSK